MDLPEGMTRVSLEPVMMNIYSDYYQVGGGYYINPGQQWLGQYLLPDDGYAYNLAEFDWIPWTWYSYGGFCGPCIVYGAFSLTQNPVSWNWISAGWAQGFVRHVPTKLGSLSMKYPGAYAIYFYNNSSWYITLYVAINMYKRWVED